MKSKTFSSASRLAVLALAFLTSICFNACSGSNDDDKEEPANSIVGTWRYEDTENKMVEKLTFLKTGTGYYECNLGIWAEFKYEAKNGKIIGEYVTIQSDYDDLEEGPFSWEYKISGDKLIIKNKTKPLSYEVTFTRVY